MSLSDAHVEISGETLQQFRAKLDGFLEEYRSQLMQDPINGYLLSFDMGNVTHDIPPGLSYDPHRTIGDFFSYAQALLHSEKTRVNLNAQVFRDTLFVVGGLIYDYKTSLIPSAEEEIGKGIESGKTSYTEFSKTLTTLIGIQSSLIDVMKCGGINTRAIAKDVRGRGWGSGEWGLG